MRVWQLENHTQATFPTKSGPLLPLNLALVREDAPQRNHELREVFNGLRWIVRTGSLPAALYATRLATVGSRLPAEHEEMAFSAGVFEGMVHDLRVLLRLSKVRASDPTATILDSRTLQSTPESGGSRGGYDGAKRKKGTKVHAAVDTLGHLLALDVTPANEQEREHVGELAETVQEATGESVELAYLDQGYTAERPELQKRRLMA